MTLPSPAQLAAAVRRDLGLGIWSIPLGSRQKRPTVRGWNSLRIKEDEVGFYFEAGSNRGRLLGSLKDSEFTPLVVVDLDEPEACLLAPHLLPPTEEKGGREGSPSSHWYYRCLSPPPTRRFNGVEGERLLELLSTGSQVVVPPSVHPSGERYCWWGDGVAEEVQAGALSAAVFELAVATMLARAAADCGPWVAEQIGASSADRIQSALMRAGFEGEKSVNEAVAFQLSAWAHLV